MSDMQRALRSLGYAPRQEDPSAPRQAAPIPDSAGKAMNGSPLAGGAGDLTEKDFSKRTYYPRRTLKSTDGIITWLYSPVEKIVMTDTKGNAVVLKFAEPK